MSVTVRHLNGDSTFLLLFSPEPRPSPSDLLSVNGAFSVLIDPWITGSSIINGKWFAITERLVPSAISHLSELEEPDVVVCSQNKPDHTHKETLLQLRPEGKTVIAAEPGAARDIRSWNHFDPNRVFSLVKYDPKARFGNSLRFFIPPLSSTGLSGELVISFIPAKYNVTGLHNAIGITYQAPTKFKAVAPVTTIDLPKPTYFHLPLSPTSIAGTSPPQLSPTKSGHQTSATDSQETIVPVKPSDRSREQRPSLSRVSNTASSDLLSFPDQPSIRPSMEDLRRQQSKSKAKPKPVIKLEADDMNKFVIRGNLPTPPDSPDSYPQLSITPMHQSSNLPPKSSTSSLSTMSDCHTRDFPRKLSVSNKAPTFHPAKPKAISILYTPHGISTSDLYPYVQNHLVKLPGALPLTLLLHPFEYAQNPWYFGGNIMTGAPGGIDIAKALMARCWISAHDEPKEKKGVSVALLKQEHMSTQEIRRELARDKNCQKYGWMCDVRTLSCGKELFLSASERDLLTGLALDGIRQGTGTEYLTLMRRPSISAGD